MSDITNPRPQVARSEMSIDSSLPLKTESAASDPAQGDVQAGTLWQRVSAGLERAGEWLNPLLVKECRQALKSRQFAITFSLVLLLCWLWSIVRIAQLGPDVPYRFDGPEMFFGYYLILAAPLLLIIPFTAFRSLIAEREDNTFELVAITSLRPRQIVGGKLGSAVVQMLVYFSAVAPCLAFTYLLRGIDVLTIGLLLYYTFIASLTLSLVTLFLATLAKEKHWQILLSVLIVIGLFYILMGAAAACHGIMRYTHFPVQEPVFWEVNLALGSLLAALLVLIYLAAGAQLTFPSENRSTPLRIAMLVAQVTLIGWGGYFAVKYGLGNQESEALAAASFSVMLLSSGFWYLMGAMLVGENPQLSPRVRRGLPKTSLGRALFTWFNPGPGTGYFFVVSNLLATAAICLFGVFIWTLQSRVPGGGPTPQMCVQGIAMFVSYAVIYLGVVHLFIRLLRRFTTVTPAHALLINLLVLAAGWGIPHVIREFSDHTNLRPYTLLHISDPFWSCGEVIGSRGSTFMGDTLLYILVPVAAGVLILSFIKVGPEIQVVRGARPQRVEEEDAALESALHPPQYQPKDPWDTPETAIEASRDARGQSN